MQLIDFLLHMCDGEIISLSSDEETPPKKKIKPAYLGSITITPIKKANVAKNKSKDDIVVLSDDDSKDDTFTNNAEVTITKQDDNQYKINEIIKKTPALKDADVEKVEDICEISESSSEEESSGKENHAQLNSTVDNEGANVKECMDSITNELKSESVTNENEESHTQNTQANSGTSHVLLDQFLELCGKRVEGSKFKKLAEEKFPILKRFYKKVMKC
nr:unnamed protein product [Callosobruchus chinensis]